MPQSGALNISLKILIQYLLAIFLWLYISVCLHSVFDSKEFGNGGQRHAFGLTGRPHRVVEVSRWS